MPISANYHTPNIVESRVKCRKCKGIDITLTEIWVGSTITWDQYNGKFDRNDGNLEPGDPIRCEAECKNCKHHWKLKYANQIDYVVK